MRKWVCLECLWTEGESPRTVEATSRGGYLAPELAGVGAHARQNPCWPGPSDRWAEKRGKPDSRACLKQPGYKAKASGGRACRGETQLRAAVPPRLVLTLSGHPEAGEPGGCAPTHGAALHGPPSGTAARRLEGGAAENRPAVGQDPLRAAPQK